MNQNGWVKDYRKLLAWPWFTNPNVAHFWEYCRLKATHVARRAVVGTIQVDLRPGQFVFGRRMAALETGLTEQIVRTCTKKLTLEGCLNLTKHSTNLFSIATICNWERYQSENDDANQGINQPPTNLQPTSNQPPTTDKNTKNVKNVKNTAEETLSADADGACSGFSDFWKAWPKHPRKVGKAKCLEVWKRQGLASRAGQVVAAVEQDKQSHGWTKDGGEYIPAPLVWLHQKRWDRDADCGPVEPPQPPEDLGARLAAIQERRKQEQALL